MSVAGDRRMQIEGLLRASDEERLDLLRAFTRELMAAAENEPIEQIVSTLRKAIVPTLDYTSAQTLYRTYRKLKPAIGKGKPSVRLAVLGSSNVDTLAECIELFLFGAGASVEVYASDYGVFRQEILDPQSRLYDFRPDRVFLATSWRDLAHVPTFHDSREVVQQRVENEVADWSSLWRTLQERLGCQILQNGFDPPPWRTFGNHERRHPGAFGRYVSLVNQAFFDAAPDFVTIHDTAALSAEVGGWQWADQRFYHQAKLPCAPECLVGYAHNVSSLLAAHSGLSRKCLVLDLDNTLWGGVIGDDGLQGIVVGQGDALGESFQAFQRYVKQLQLRGIILAVCSKNDEKIAQSAFNEHSEMVLRLDDISSFRANWENKPANLRSIAEELNIGLNSMVFIDDNPAERAIVRQMLPEVATPEVSEDPTDFIRVLEQHRYFETVAVADEDFQRTEFYRTNAARANAESSFGTVEEFLRSLEMIARIRPIAPENIERCAQLIGRSNQFNLTTRRRTTAELQKLLEQPDWHGYAVSLSDRFGDNGIISVILANVAGDAFVVDSWLMSCRVLKRGVEDCVLNHLVGVARQNAVSTIRGEYIPTPKNGLVRDHYRTLGFHRTLGSEGGESTWELAVTNELEPRTHYMSILTD